MWCRGRVYEYEEVTLYNGTLLYDPFFFLEDRFIFSPYFAGGRDSLKVFLAFHTCGFMKPFLIFALSLSPPP